MQISKVGDVKSTTAKNSNEKHQCSYAKKLVKFSGGGYIQKIEGSNYKEII